jgi:hypothetical protein
MIISAFQTSIYTLEPFNLHGSLFPSTSFVVLRTAMKSIKIDLLSLLLPEMSIYSTFFLLQPLVIGLYVHQAHHSFFWIHTFPRL